MATRMHYTRYCVVKDCLNSNRKDPELTLFKLPKDPDRRREWLAVIGRKDLLQKENLKHDSYRVCALHFSDSSIKVIKQLKPDAVPIKSFTDESENTPSASTKKTKTTQTQRQRYLEKSTQTTDDSHEKSQRKRKHSKVVKASNTKRKRSRSEYEVNIKRELDDSNDTKIKEDIEVLNVSKFKEETVDQYSSKPNEGIEALDVRKDVEGQNGTKIKIELEVEYDPYPDIEDDLSRSN